MVVVAVSAAFLLIDGVVNTDWIQVLWVALLAICAAGWWNDGPPRPTRRESSHAGRLLVSAALAAAGTLVLISQDSLLLQLAGGLLVFSALCGVVAFCFRLRANE